MAAAAAVTPDAGGSGSSSSRDRPNWIMLDLHVFTRLDLNSCKEDETTSPLCHTSQGPFQVSFRFAAPPAISHFYLHVQGGNLSEPSQSSCSILASHKDAVLFCIYVPLPVPVEYLSNPEDEPFPRFFKQDLFVYIAGDNPSLKLIPPCPNPEKRVEDLQLYNPVADIVQFWDAEAISILRDEEENYIVGYLCVSTDITSGSGAEEVEAQLCLYYSYDSSWELIALPIFCNPEDIDPLLHWSTSTALAFGQYLCWIDYKCGVLFCDMSEEQLKVIYLPLPVEHRLVINVCMETYRSICIVQDEGALKMKFVDVRPSHGYVNRLRPDSFEINLCTLVVEDRTEWKHECVLRDDELCIDKLVPSPHGPLMLPVVSMEDPQMTYFLICETGYDAKKAWVVPIDLISRSMMYVLLYDKDADNTDKSRTSWQAFAPFLPSEITKFFQQIPQDSTVVMEAHDSLPNCLQDDILADSLEGPVLPWVSSYVLEPILGRMSSKASMEFAQNTIPHFVFPQGVIKDIQTEGFQQISFRLLCPINLVGGLIGERGFIIREIEYRTGASIVVGACVGGCKECVIAIAAIEV